MDGTPNQPRSDPGADPQALDEGEAPVLALRVLSGAYEGSEYPLLPDRQIVIGRSRDADVVLIGDDRVSREHARLQLAGSKLLLEDLGSTNGCFVNGERVTTTCQVGRGDRIDIGTSTMRIVATAKHPSSADRARARMKEAAELRSTRQRSMMRGQLAEIPLVALLQLLAPGRKSGVIHLQTEDASGRVHMRRGKVRHAALDEDWASPPIDALYELLQWDEGTFEVRPDDGEIFADEISMPLDMILMEAMSRLDGETDLVIDEQESSECTIEIDEPPDLDGPATEVASPPPAELEAPEVAPEADPAPPDARRLEPRSPTGEELSLGRIHWRTDMTEPFDREAVFQTAISLNGHTESDWVALREVAATTLTWADPLVEGFSEVHVDPRRCAVLFEDGREPAGEDELQIWRDVIESWLSGILPGEGGESFWRESWVAGLVHLSRGVRNVLLLSWMARLQRLFRDRCVEAFDVEQALAVSDAFERITDTAVALACESREAGIMESVSKIGINESLLRKIQSQAVKQLIDNERNE